MSSPEPEYTDIIICGCGPTGAYLSALLSRLGVHHIVLEKEFAITTDPRGIALDEDGIRALQSVGLYEPTFREIGKPMGIFNFIEAKGGDLSTRAFCKFDYRTIEGGTGHPGFLCHKQPSMEKHLRSAISSDFGQVKHGCEVDYIDEDEDGVLVGYKDIIGSNRCVRGKFLVAADGKTGFTRKKYLEPKGIVMERNPKADYEATWIAMNWHITLPTPTTHPNFPLFKLGYSPTEIYDLFFPDNFFFVICDASRPAVFGRFGRNDDHLIRFEFVVKEGEDAKETSAVREASKIFLPYVTHPGKRYGLQGKVRWPEDCMTCIRSSAFSFTARSCNRWSRNRVILVGDSAHVFPPFGGQGISSGFRDALSLSWRLKIAVQEGCWFYEDLLMGWYLERKQQLERSLEATIVNGELLTESSKWKRFWRNWYFWFLQLVPSWRHDLELGGRKDGMIRYQWSKGMPFLQQFGGGKSFPQVFSAPLYAAAPEIPSFTDDAVFSQHKKGVFQLVALLTDLTELRIAQWELRKFFQAFDLTKLEMPGGRPKSEESMIAQIKQPDESTTFELLHPDETTFILHNVKRSTRPPENLFSEIFAEENSIRVIDAEEYEQAGVRHASSNRNPFPRPDAKFYNPNRIRKDLGFDMRFVIVRFDRVVYAACRSLDELRVALKGLQISIQDSCND